MYLSLAGRGYPIDERALVHDMRTVAGSFIVTLTGVGLLACGLVDPESRPLSLSLDVDPSTVRAGETVTVRADAEGQSLVWIVMEYGDTGVDTFLTVGFQQSVSATHTYDQPGEKVIRATLRDGELGETAKTTTVQVLDTVP